MWDSITPYNRCNWEPVELRILKKELAHLTCRCNTCETFRNPSLHFRGYQNDEAVQVEQKSKSPIHHRILDKYIYATADPPPKTDDSQKVMEYFRSDAFCPNCYFIWDILRRTTKVLKDEESETKPDSSDKSTEKDISFIDTSTSVTNNNKLLSKASSNLTFCDYISDTNSTSSSSFNDRCSQNTDKKKITFLDDIPSKEEVKKEPPTFVMHGNCFCLDNLMATIRPPLKNL